MMNEVLLCSTNLYYGHDQTAKGLIASWMMDGAKGTRFNLELDWLAARS